MKKIRTIARRTLAEWVRRALRTARVEADRRRKLQVLRAATAHSFPTADIDEMLAQIERGYGEERS